MKAIVHDQFGGPEVLRFIELEKPGIGEEQILIRVRGAALHPGDWLMMTGQPLLFRPAFGVQTPRKRVPGFDVAGTVEAVGSATSEFQPGDEVFGEAPTGSCAEYVAVAEDNVAPNPSALTLNQGAVVPVSGTTALRGLRDAGKLRAGQHVLINGAGGGIGTFAVQIAKAFGAEVTGVCSAGKADLVTSMGADHVIDYTKENFTHGGGRYDLILDNVANHSMADCRRALTSTGVYLTNNGTAGNRWVGPLGRMAGAAVLSIFVSKQGRPFYAPVRKQDLLDLTELIDAGSVTPVIGASYPLAEAARAMEQVGQGHAEGKVAITV
jgi:NADPH:quinone reductase-like Zn-dependent oxidoreductase